MRSALLKFAPVYDPRIITDPKLARTLVVERGALEAVVRDEPIHVVVDHERQVGTVREIFTAPDVLYGRHVTDFYFASVELTDAPAWLKRGGGVSWSHRALHTREVGESTVLVRGLIDEVSLLSPSVQPAEPFATISWVGEEEHASRAAAGEVIPRDGTLVRRYFANAVLAVGGKPLLRTSSGQAIRREGHDYVIDQPDGSQLIYSSEGYREALRDGQVVGVR